MTRAPTVALKTTPNRRLSDRTLNRLIVGLLLVIGVGVAAIAVVYWSDRHVTGGGSAVDRTLTAAEAAVRADPNRLSTRLTLAAAYATAGRNEDARAQYDEVLAAEPNNRAGLLGRADAQRKLEQYDGATADYQALIDIAKDGEMAAADPQLEAAYYGLGAVALAQQRPADAARDLANALLIDGTDADALDLMGQALIGINDYPSAVEALRNAVALVPSGWCDPYAHLGQAYTGLGDADGTSYANGMVALCEHRTAEAQQLLTPLTGGQHARDALIGLGLTAEAQGDTATAQQMYQQVLDKYPTDFAAQTGMGRVAEGQPNE